MLILLDVGVSIVVLFFVLKNFKKIPIQAYRERKDDLAQFATQTQHIKGLQEQLSKQQILIADLKDMFDGLSRVVERINNQMMADALTEQAKKDDPLGR